MSPRLVSVVIPSYNCDRYVAQAIRSVLVQSYRPLELVIVDDGSTDSSRDVILETIASPPLDNVVYIEQENAGAHAAIMRGLGVARGDVLAILNSDDFYAIERIEILVSRLRGADAFAFSGLEFVDGQGRPLPPTHAWPAWHARALVDADTCLSLGFALLLHNFSVTSGNFVFTRALYEKLGGLSDHRFTHDWDLLMRAVYYTEPVFVPDALMSYRIHETNTTDSVRHLLVREATEVIQRYVALCEAAPPPNTLAPCPIHWPRYFAEFVGRHAPGFAPDRQLQEFFTPLLQRRAGNGAPPA